MDRSGTLLYDADCGLCIATARWLGRAVPARRLGLFALQDVETEPSIAARVAGMPLTDRLHFVRADGTVLTGAAAALAAGRLVPVLGFYAALLDQPIGHLVLEPLYDEIAAHRRQIGRLLGLPEVCPLPTRPRDADWGRPDPTSWRQAGPTVDELDQPLRREPAHR
ncbi:MAG TPA: DCC1-like thiol-disulfide oxidoreductase family protein [Candidatus Dormibacteraeota bacterium]|nr:DCC1-like thiol-disulfide oxidoreductase family protein [Candidatus Dormibacteraeota bacterium]